MERHTDDIHESMWQSIGQFASLMAAQGLKQGWGFGFVYGVCLGSIWLLGVGAAFGGPIGLFIGTVAGTILGRVSGFVQGIVTVWYARRHGDAVPMADISHDLQWQRLFVWVGAVVTLIGALLLAAAAIGLLGASLTSDRAEVYIGWAFVPSLLAVWASIRGSRKVIAILNQATLAMEIRE